MEQVSGKNTAEVVQGFNLPESLSINKQSNRVGKPQIIEKMVSEQRHKDERIIPMSIREKSNPGREQTLLGGLMAGGGLMCLRKIMGNRVANTQEVRRKGEK